MHEKYKQSLQFLTMNKYVDRVDMPIKGTGSLMFYKRPELNSDTWHYRAKIE